MHKSGSLPRESLFRNPHKSLGHDKLKAGTTMFVFLFPFSSARSASSVIPLLSVIMLHRRGNAVQTYAKLRADLHAYLLRRRRFPRACMVQDDAEETPRWSR